MNPPQPKFEHINSGQLLEQAHQCRRQGARLVQISATRRPEKFELDYTFESDNGFQNYRILVGVDSPKVPSITPAYWCAFLYENEIHDLFGIEIDGLAVDFKGNLYKTTVKYALGQACTRKTPPAAAASTAKPTVVTAAPSATNTQS